MFNIFRYTSIAIFFLTTASSNSEELKLTTNGELYVYSLGNCPLVGGEVIEDCHLAYRTQGTLAEDKSNVMLIPTWLGGNSEDFIKSGYVGSGKMADTDKYYVIIVEAFGSGNSSSPSNSVTQHNGAFPEFSITDMVDAQHQLLTNQLGLDHVSAVIGISLGASQTYHWMSKYPNFLDQAVIITGTPKLTTSDKLSYRLAIDAVTGLLKLNDDGKQARNFIIRFERHMAWTSSWFAREIPSEEFQNFDRKILKDTRVNPYDYRVQTTALLYADITSQDGGDLSKTAARLKMPFLTLSHNQDGYINPAPSQELADLSNNPNLFLSGDCGHYSPDCELQELVTEVHKFLK